MDNDIYVIALALIEQHGENATGFALRETMRFVREEDVKQAGRWLVIGQAVETLAGMPPATRGIDESVSCRRLPSPRPFGCGPFANRMGFLAPTRRRDGVG